VQVSDLKSVLDKLSNESNRAATQVAEQISALREVSTGTLTQAGDLASRLDTGNRELAQASLASLESLAEATSRLEQIEQRVAMNLSSRRSGIEELVARVASQSEDIESITRSFAALVEDSLKAAEERARQIGGLLADSAQAGTAAITEQFEAIRSTTGKERERTAHALRQAYEQVAAEVGGELTKVTTQFQTAAEELRSMTATIQSELETTRAELKRGVIDMPRETQEATAAMRRVVAEQIKAVNDLSGLVGRSGRALDIAEPAPAPAAARRPEPLPEPRRATPPIPEATPRRAPEPVQPTPATQQRPRVETQQPRAGGSWLSDILGRASRDEPAAPPPAQARREQPAAQTIERLDSLSVDIARMIDHNAAIDLWDRYKRGERNVFTRRLYTLQGQQTFDEIRRRYRSDGDFRDTVDRYIEEFERLLGEVAKDDRDNMVANTYLTSDTGKVYTMLAHASGRFE
jgi:hypothetical protein